MSSKNTKLRRKSRTLSSKLMRFINQKPKMMGSQLKLEVRASTIPNAGNGVHLIGSAKQGDIVAVYKGLVFDHDDFLSIAPFLLPGNDYLMSCRDDIVIDGRPDGPSNDLFLSCLYREAVKAKISYDEAKKRASRNPYAVGQMINHPPRGTEANVQVLAMDLEESSPEVELLRWVCVPYKRKEKNSRLRVVLLVAKRKLKNEELFLDYKFLTEKPPDWYTKTLRQ